MDFIPKLSGTYSLDKAEPAPAAEPAKETDKTASASDTDSNFNSHTVWDREANYAKVTFRLKSAAGVGLAMLIVYGVIATLSGGPKHSAEKRMEIAAEERFNPEERTIEGARAKAGFFNRLFCSGLRRSSFCE